MTELEQLLIEQNRRQSEQISELTQQVKNLNEQIAYMNRKRFGASSEQNIPGQTDLFGNPFESSETTELEQTVVVPSHRCKVRGYKEA
ncbi:transposase [Weissella confusa]|uniref:transposase n=1 Tax=Weissella confusa TaxID=1583 RepID=UPI002F26C50C